MVMAALGCPEGAWARGSRPSRASAQGHHTPPPTIPTCLLGAPFLCPQPLKACSVSSTLGKPFLGSHSFYASTTAGTLVGDLHWSS